MMENQMVKHPDIVLVPVDDTGYCDVQPFSGEAPMPGCKPMPRAKYVSITRIYL